MKKKALSLVLSAAMVLSLAVPVSAVSVSNFGDVPSDSWYYDSVRYVAEKDYMNGTSATTFSPNDPMTRAMFATVISRISGAEVDNTVTSEFTDVKSNQWYTGAIEWGVENELLNGYGNGLFGTNDSITRQDICTLTQRFLDWFCVQNNCALKTEPKVESFTDAASIADYAQEAVEFCRDAGLLTGYEDGSFRPLGTATRAEIAAVIERIELAMQEATLAVTYTDEDGEKATLPIAVGDVITIDLNGGSIVYDGKTYRDEFTITAGEDGIVLPDATRSGYTFDGWKVEKDANGAYTFIAQWTKNPGGGGGGGGGTTYYTYTLNWNYNGEAPNITDTVKSGTNIDLPSDLPEGFINKGFTLVGWNTEADGSGSWYDESYTVNSEITLYAQWKESSYVRDYSLNLNLKIKDKTPIDIPANTENGDAGNKFEGTSKYHVVFNNDGTVNKNASDHIELVNIAKDLCEEGAIDTVLENLKDFTYSGDKKLIDDNGVVQDIVVAHAPVVDVLDNNVSDIAESLNVNETEVSDILSALDNGTLTSVEQDSDQEKILKKVQEKLNGLLNPQADKSLYDTIIEEKIVSEDLLKKLGFEESDINKMAGEYLKEIDSILGIEPEALDTREGSNAGTEGGIPITVNPVKVISKQYGTDSDKYNGIWTQIQKALGEEDTGKLKEYDSVQKLIAACDPAKFFTVDGDVYTIKTADQYADQFKDLIDSAEAARKQVIIDEKRTSENVVQLLTKLRDGLDYGFLTSKLNDERITELSELLVIPEPLLTDLPNIKDNPTNIGTHTAFIEVSVGDKSKDIDLNDTINKILEKIGVNRTDLDEDLIQEVINRLSGDYSATVTINVKECE